MRPAYAIVVFALLAACDNGNAPLNEKPASTLVPGAAPQASDRPVQKPTYEDPAAGQTLYVVNVQTADGKPVARAKVALLNAMPEPLYMDTPVRATVMSEYVTPLHGTAPLSCVADNGARFIWVGGLGFESSVTPVENAASAARFTHTINVTILPIATLTFKDPKGGLVANAIVTIKEKETDPNIGHTYRSDDGGELKVTLRSGTYYIDAADDQGHHRYVNRSWQFNGTAAPITIDLPEKSMQ